MKRKLLLSLVLALSISLTACGGDKAASFEAVTEEVAWDSSYDMAEEAPAMATNGFSGSDASLSETTSTETVQTDQKIITTYNYGVETKTYDEFVGGITAKVTEYGGYIESSNEWNSGGYNRSSSFTIRIPQDKMRTFLGEVENNANVKSKSTDTENVTLQYVDLESHIKALETEEETLLRLMEQAEKLEDLLTVQRELTDVRYQLQSYESQRRSLENRISYDTLYLSISEVDRETPVVKNPTFWEEVSEGFMENVRELGTGIRGFLVWLFSHIISIIFWIALIIIATKIIKKLRGPKMEKPAKKRRFLGKNKNKEADNLMAATDEDTKIKPDDN